MIRERRNKEKLALYYKKFMEEGIVDPNVHPWVAESWQLRLYSKFLVLKWEPWSLV